MKNTRNYVSNSKNGVVETYEEIILNNLYDITLIELAYFCNPICHKMAYQNSKSYRITYDKLSKKSKRSYKYKRWGNTPFSRYWIFLIIYIILKKKREKVVKSNIVNLIENYKFDSYFIRHRKSILAQQIKPE